MEDSRPWMFLISTTTAAKDIRNGLGTPAYSYYFAVEALIPVFNRFGAWKLIDRPESRLTFAAAKAESDGFRPVHLAVNPLQDCYFSPALPNLVFPFWEFPNIPDRDLGDDTRQNWVRIVRGASQVLTACEFTATAFQKAKIDAPVYIIPIPVPPRSFDLPNWDPHHAFTFDCRHEVLGSSPKPTSGRIIIADAPSKVPSRPWLLGRSAFRRISPWLRPETVDRIAGVGRALRSIKAKSLAKNSILGLRGSYRRHIRPLLSDKAVERVTGIKEASLRAVGREPSEPIDPLLPSSPLTLTGLVYLSIFNIGDPRKNWHDLLSAFLLAYQDREDVTLVIKLVTSRRCEFHEIGLLRSKYEAMRIEHRCRVVAITEYLDETQMDDLFRVTTFYVNTSHAEGACLPLMRALAGGRPVLAPNHSAMADYIDPSIAFILRSNPEPTCWPHDPEKRLSTMRHRLVWSDIHDAFQKSGEMATTNREAYQRMADAARVQMQNYASLDRVEECLRLALTGLDSPTTHKVAGRMTAS